MPTIVGSQLRSGTDHSRQFFIVCAADMLICAHIYNHCFLLQDMSLSCPLPSLAGLFKSKVRDGSYCKKTGNWCMWGYKMLGFFSLETGTDGNRFLHPENKVLQQMCFAVPKRILDDVSRGTRTVSCLWKGFTRPSMLNQLPTAQLRQVKIPEFNQV